MLTLAFACCLGIAVFGRPGIAAALSLVAFVVLIALSRMKFDVTQLTLTFLDLLLIDPDTFSFLVTIASRAEMEDRAGRSADAAAAVRWCSWLDPFRIRRRIALGGRRRWRCSAWSVCR